MIADSIPIYLLPGMTSDFPVFSRLLPLLPSARLLEFLPPEPRETLVNYSSRMATLLPKDAFIGGVSFGGIIALEISRILRPRGCILISSIRHPRELPPWFRIWRPFGGRCYSALLRTIGGAASLVPRSARTASTIRARSSRAIAAIGTAGPRRQFSTGSPSPSTSFARFFKFTALRTRHFQSAMCILTFPYPAEVTLCRFRIRMKWRRRFDRLCKSRERRRTDGVLQAIGHRTCAF